MFRKDKIRPLPQLLFVSLLFLFCSCEDEVTLDTGTADPILNIDAWINNKPETQIINLTLTQDYFDNSNLPPVASDAQVRVTDQDGEIFEFVEDSTSRTGAYRWEPGSGQVFGVIGNTYVLEVTYKGNVYTASSTMKRVPPVDSLTLSYEKGSGMIDDMYRAEFWGSDFAGKGDTYWVRAYKNGQLLNKPSEVTTAYDGGTSSGGGFDGVTFITPVRLGVNANDLDEDDRPKSPLVNGDSIYAEIHSIDLPAFQYLAEVVTQATDKVVFLSFLLQALWPMFRPILKIKMSTDQWRWVFSM